MVTAQVDGRDDVEKWAEWFASFFLKKIKREDSCSGHDAGKVLLL